MHVRFLGPILIVSLVIPQVARGQDKLVSRSELQAAISAAAETRQKNLDDTRTFFASEPARAALKAGHIDHRRVNKAVRTLSAVELQRLAERARGIQNDFAAGALNNQELTYIIIALAAAVVVLIAVQ